MKIYGTECYEEKYQINTLSFLFSTSLKEEQINSKIRRKVLLKLEDKPIMLKIRNPQRKTISWKDGSLKNNQ